jgi:hypothetical protein
LGANWHQERVRQIVLDARRIGQLVESLPEVIARVREGLLRLADALEVIDGSGDGPST